MLYWIADAAFRNLDRYEGVPEHYRRSEVNATDSSGNKIAAQVYRATEVENGLWPAPHYLQMILEGVQEHGLLAAYIEQIKVSAQAG